MLVYSGVTTSPTPQCSSYWKGSLLVALDYGHQLVTCIQKKSPLIYRCTKLTDCLCWREDGLPWGTKHIRICLAYKKSEKLKQKKHACSKDNIFQDMIFEPRELARLGRGVYKFPRIKPRNRKKKTRALNEHTRLLLRTWCCAFLSGKAAEVLLKISALIKWVDVITVDFLLVHKNVGIFFIRYYTNTQQTIYHSIHNWWSILYYIILIVSFR